ncbi:hypothetical protein SCOR_18680 [Sulfidibacter corallicola]
MAHLSERPRTDHSEKYIQRMYLLGTASLSAFGHAKRIGFKRGSSIINDRFKLFEFIHLLQYQRLFSPRSPRPLW